VRLKGVGCNKVVYKSQVGGTKAIGLSFHSKFIMVRVHGTSVDENQKVCCGRGPI